jgi:hypothetical protein
MVIKSYRYLKTLSLALAVELAMSSGLSATAIQYSQQQQPQNSRGELLALQRRLRFSVRGLRPSRGLRGGAARGGCLSANDSLKLIVPPVVSEQEKDKVYSVSTIAAHPKFFVYIPQTSAQKAEFIISDNNENEIVKEKFALTGTPGVIAFSLPSNATPLEVGKTYKWSLEILCEAGNINDPASVDRNPFVQGEVERIQPPATLVNIGKVAPSERPDLYAQSQVWYESISSLAELQYANPQDLRLKKDWEDLLKSVNLDTVAEAPLLPEATMLQWSNPNN